MLSSLVMLTALLLAFPLSAGQEKFAWHSPDEGLAKAAREDKIVLVDVYVRGCGWCRRMDRQVFSRNDIQAYLAEKFVPVKLDGMESKKRVEIAGREFTHAELTREYGVEGFPTTLFLEPNGKLIFKSSGYRPPDQFMRMLRYFGERELGREDRQEAP